MTEPIEKYSDKHTFTRDETEAIVEARLARERRNNESLIPVRELIARLRRAEPYRSLSTAALSELILKVLGQTVKDTEPSLPPRADGTTDGEPEASDEALTETPPEIPEQAPTEEALPEKPSFERAEPRIDDAEKAKTVENAESEEQARARRKEDIRRFLAEFGEETLLSALRDDAFRTFCVGKSGDLCTLYRGYLAFLSALTESQNARLCRAAERQLASTGFSNIASGAPDYGALLTENQKSIAKASGMSYRDYAAFLEQIPKKRL
mgnify:CR=1 FL=1